MLFTLNCNGFNKFFIVLKKSAALKLPTFYILNLLRRDRFPFHRLYGRSEVQYKDKGFNQRKGYHFHNCTFTYHGKKYGKGAENQKCAYGESFKLLMLFYVEYEKQSNRCHGKSDKAACCDPMSESFGIPVLNAVTESEGNAHHTYKAQHTKGV